MRPWQKIVTTFWTTLLAAPVLWFTIAYSMGTCEDLDAGCETGGHLPYHNLVLLILVAVTLGHLAFLRMVWRTGGADIADHAAQ